MAAESPISAGRFDCLLKSLSAASFSSLARGGGFGSTLWAGPNEFSRSVLRGDYPVQGTVCEGPISLRLGFAGDEFGYAIDLGLPIPTDSALATIPRSSASAFGTERYCA